MTVELSEVMRSSGVAQTETKGKSGGGADANSSADPASAPAAGLKIAISPEAVFRILVIVALANVIVGTCARLAIYAIAPDFDDPAIQAPPLARLLSRLDLGHEPSLPQLYSSMLLAASSVLLAVVAVTRSERGLFSRARWPWWFLSIGFAYLSIDEAVTIHEMVNSVLGRFAAIGGVLNFPWVLVGGIVVLLVALSLLPFLLRLDARTRNYFLASGAIYVGGAIGLELVESVIFETSGIASTEMTLAIAVEEGLEMLGVTLFIYALLDFLRRHGGSLRIDLSPRRRPARR